MEPSAFGHGPTFASLMFVATLSGTFVVVFLVASTLASWFDERVRRASVRIERGASLRSGFGTFQGIARSLELEHDPNVPLVASTRLQEWRGGASAAAWHEIERESTGQSFILVLDSGDEILVDGQRFQLDGFPEIPSGVLPSRIGLIRRNFTSAIRHGDPIWATGVLSKPVERTGGAYRSGIVRRTLRAPKGKSIELSAASPAARWKRKAWSHKVGAFMAIGSLAFCHLAFWRKLDIAFFTDDIERLGRYARWLEIPPVFALPGIVLLIVTLVVWLSSSQKA